MSSKHFRSAREHLAQADALAAETDQAVEDLREAKMDAEAATLLVGVLQLATNRGVLHAKLAEVHVALAGCPVD
jgi:predicted trehalose synthase